ncbi:MAG TPA: alpha/beta hydrolase [Phenylobacterium sp.]
MTGATEIEIATRETTIFATRQGSGPPLLLLHGFPETHAMWRDVAPRLAERFSVVCADLRGYGRSGCPPSAPDHAPYAKRAMGQDMIQVMDHFGFGRFGVCGHDRGGRVAYRMALDHPDRIARLAVLDIVPTEDAFARADARLALGFWPWSLLAQPEPLPERLLAAGAEAVIDDAASQWGSASDAFPAAIRAGYAAVLRNTDHAHAICEEYRAAATLDRAHDCADRAAGRRIGCPVLALWGAGGAVETWYPEGPLAIWRGWADDVTGAGVEGGHFFPEARPDETAARLAAFFA